MDFQHSIFSGLAGSGLFLDQLLKQSLMGIIPSILLAFQAVQLNGYLIQLLFDILTQLI